MRYKIQTVVGVVFLGLAVLALVSALTQAAPRSSQTIEGADQAPRVCFPKKDWGPASDQIRPCVKVTRVEEDGSFRFSVSDGDGTVRYTSGVSNLSDGPGLSKSEEEQTLRIACERHPGLC